MKRILHIQASPMAELSYSKAVTTAFIDSCTQVHPQDRVRTLELFKVRLPAFDGDIIRAKYAIMHGKPHSNEQKKAWDQVLRVIRQFKNADKYVFSVPMWNFGIPYRLKHYLDLIIQPGETFTFSPQEGYKGLVTGKPVMVVYARGGEYPAGSPFEAYDLQKKYLELALRFIGFTDIRSIVVESTLSGPEKAAASRNTAMAEARKAAETF